jgi:hypothetical protein
LIAIDGGLTLKIARTIANSGHDGVATVLPLGLGAIAMNVLIVAVARWRGLRLSLKV